MFLYKKDVKGVRVVKKGAKKLNSAISRASQFSSALLYSAAAAAAAAEEEGTAQQSAHTVV